jgi:hypothetical protein
VIAPAPVRLQQTCEVRVHLKNEGTDLLRDVRCELDLPSALVIEGVSGASAVGGRLTFADIPPGAPLEAALTLRLVEAQISGTSVPLRAIVSAAHQQPLILSAAVETFAMPQLESAQLAVRGMMGPAPFAPGDTIECELSVENVGDGVAERLTIEAHGDAALVPLAGTTRVDGIAVSEYNDRVRLYGTRGLTLAELAPGAPLRVRWQARIAADALDERSLVVRAGVRVGDADPLVVASAPFAIAPRPVRAPAPPPIAETEPSYPPPAPWPEVVPEPEPEYEPEPEPVVMDEVPAHEHDPAIAFVAMRCDLDRLRLARILKQLRSLRDREDGLLFRHVLVPRFFWPDHIDDGAPAFDRERLHMAALLETARESIRTLTTAVLLKIGVPGTDIDTDVIESLHDDRLRSALRALLTELADAPGLVVEPSAGRSLASLTTSVSLATLRRLGAEYGDGDHDDVLATSRVIAFFMTTQSAFPAVQLAMTEYWNELIRTLELCRSTDDLFDIAPQTLDERLAELIDVFDENQERFAGDAEESAAAS